MPEHRHEAIVIGEAQDIDSVWWLPLLELLADAERGVLFVFGDANQYLYHADPDEIGVVMPERLPVYCSRRTAAPRAQEGARATALGLGTSSPRSTGGCTLCSSTSAQSEPSKL